MLDLKAHDRLTRAWSDAAFNCARASAMVATVAATSALQVWGTAMTGAVGGTNARPLRLTPTTRSWYRAPYHTPFTEALLWTETWSNAARSWLAWQQALDMTNAWLPTSPLATTRSLDLFSPWTMMAAFMRPFPRGGWSDAESLFPQMMLFAQQATAFSPAVAPTNPFSVYRTDGGHASAQILSPKVAMQAAMLPFLLVAPMHRLLSAAVA